MIKALSGLLGTASCVTMLLIVPAASADLTAGEIRDELVGRSIVWWENGGWNGGQLKLSPDGSAEITLQGAVQSDDTGRWALRGAELCTEWGGLRGGETKCYSVRRDGGLFITTGGNVFQVMELGV